VKGLHLIARCTLRVGCKLALWVNVFLALIRCFPCQGISVAHDLKFVTVACVYVVLDSRVLKILVCIRPASEGLVALPLLESDLELKSIPSIASLTRELEDI
jgi:hypothetical protein